MAGSWRWWWRCRRRRRRRRSAGGPAKPPPESPSVKAFSLSPPRARARSRAAHPVRVRTGASAPRCGDGRDRQPAGPTGGGCMAAWFSADCGTAARLSVRGALACDDGVRSSLWSGGWGWWLPLDPRGRCAARRVFEVGRYVGAEVDACAALSQLLGWFLLDEPEHIDWRVDSALRCRKVIRSAQFPIAWTYTPISYEPSRIAYIICTICLVECVKRKYGY